MCGLVSVISKWKNGFQQKQIDIFTQMLFADEVRGADGTGIFFNPKQSEGSVRILKAPYKSSSFIRTKEYEEAMNVVFKESNFIVGHNRSATKGKLDAACTHPFREGHISLVHNGTLISHKELHADYEVDSRAIAFSMEQIGYKETLKKIDGAFALIWFDAKSKTLNFCRNIQRPLFILETASSYVITSELNLGTWIIERNNDKVIKSFEVETRKLYQFSIDDMSKFTEEPLEYIVYPPVVYKSYPNNNYNSAFADTFRSITPHKGFAFGEKIKFKTGDVKHNYVEADILKFQGLDLKDNLKLTDYESLWRIKIYGAKDYLKNISNKRLCWGTINHTSVFQNKVLYTVGGVSVIEENKTATILQLPNKTDPKPVPCEWCKEEGVSLRECDGWNLCNVCAESMSTMYGM